MIETRQSVSSSALLLYRYMSPLWLQTHATFTETRSSVSAQTIEFSTGPTEFGVLFRVNSLFTHGIDWHLYIHVYKYTVSKVKLIEAGVLDDDKAYSIQIGFFFTYPGNDSVRIFKSATEITAWVLSTTIQTLLMLLAAMIQLASVAAHIVVALSLHHNRLQRTGAFALKFIRILRQELRTLAQLHTHLATVKN